jgi:N-acetylglucosamine-6-sulfatase
MLVSARWSRRVVLQRGLHALAFAPTLRRWPFLAASRPNLILILTDDMRADDLPNLPQVQHWLVDQGMTFTRCFAPTPLCGPSRASIFRGQYAHNHGVRDNTGEDAGYASFANAGDEASTLATWLHDAGYQTALFGKYLNGYPMGHDVDVVPSGWDRWAAGIDHAAYGEFDYLLNEDGRIVAYGHAPTDYLTDVLAGKATDAIAAAAADAAPFFVEIATYAPHAPSVPAPRHLGDFPTAQVPRGPGFNEADVSDKPSWVRTTPLMRPPQIAKVDARQRDRLRALAAVDDLVDAVCATLQTTGALDRTYVIFTSDNGVLEGEHRQAHGKNGPYEEAIRLPLVARGPGVPAGATSDALVATIDLAPTFADLAGVAAPSFVDGRSLVPLLRGQSPDRWRQALLLEGFGGLGDNSASTIVEPVPPFTGLRTANALYVEYATGERELYNLADDPGETINLINRANRDTVAALAGRLASLRTAREAAARTLEDAPLAAPLP